MTVHKASYPGGPFLKKGGLPLGKLAAPRKGKEANR